MVDTADRRGWVSEPDSRGTMSILYTCFLTIVLCTWTAVHLDIPPRRFSAPRRIWQKARWMVAAILAPEYITFYAVVQREGVNWAMRRPRWPWPWSRVHTFYAVMGGIELYFSDDTSIRPSFDEFCRWTDCGLIEVPLLSTEEIEDKSKGNCFTKALALLQILWFATQLVTRAIQRLEVTPLELLTAGIVVCSLVTYIAWWEKPYDVDGPTRIQLGSKARFFEPLEVYRFSGTSADSKTDQWLRALRTFVPRFTYAILEEQDFQVALHPGNYDYRGFPSFLDGVGGTRFREIMLGESCASITSKELRWWRRHQSLIRNMYECERRTLISHDTSHVRRRPFTLIAPDDPEESRLSHYWLELFVSYTHRTHIVETR
ncbi:MAG: hypothetical protein M1833_007042 [Piccolia ochrophora]|nr:MAG: hypothetical protein M1833_007042 [Piccolia ochrophora]